MIIPVPVMGFFPDNSYIYADEKTQHGFLIDPGAEADRLYFTLLEEDITIDAIILTHGHFDSMGAASELSQRLHAPIYAHSNGKDILKNAKLNMSDRTGDPITLSDEITYVQDGDVINLKVPSELSLQVIHTPGHTPDSISLYSAHDGIVFTGDTIMKGSMGSHLYPGGDEHALRESILKHIFRLPVETTIAPGHGETTTVGLEMQRYGISFASTHQEQ